MNIHQKDMEEREINYCNINCPLEHDLIKISERYLFLEERIHVLKKDHKEIEILLNEVNLKIDAITRAAHIFYWFLALISTIIVFLKDVFNMNIWKYIQ